MSIPIPQPAIPLSPDPDIRPTQRRCDPFKRHLTREDERLLLEQVAEPLGLTPSAQHLRYLAQRTCQIESLCVGRLAGDVQDAVLRLLAAQAATRDGRLRILEIGVLFAVNAALTWDVLSSLGVRCELTLIDPLEGYYGVGRNDIASGLPVSRRNAQWNLSRCGVDPRQLARPDGTPTRPDR